ncbi:hypothetical protein PILCRDRAFT_816089, partial [Piloderma croceum F 1598]
MTTRALIFIESDNPFDRLDVLHRYRHDRGVDLRGYRLYQGQKITRGEQLGDVPL